MPDVLEQLIQRLVAAENRIAALERLETSMRLQVKDAEAVWRDGRGDANGGLFAGPYGSFNDVVAETVLGNESGGAATATSTAVPAGELHVVTYISAYHTDTGSTRELRLMRNASGSALYIKRRAAATAIISEEAGGEFVLKEGEYITAQCPVIGVGFAIRLTIHGYKVDLS